MKTGGTNNTVGSNSKVAVTIAKKSLPKVRKAVHDRPRTGALKASFRSGWQCVPLCCPNAPPYYHKQVREHPAQRVRRCPALEEKVADSTLFGRNNCSKPFNFTKPQKLGSANFGIRTSTHGFTILELLVATTVSIILLGLFLSVSTHILDAWGQSRDSLSANAKARIVLDTLSSDLESAIIRDDPGVWLAADLLEADTQISGRWEDSDISKPSGDASLEIDFSDPSLTAKDYRFGIAGCWIRFFASPADASESGYSGDVNAIAYQLIRRKPHSQSSEADESYNLYRSIVRSDHTLDEVIEDKGYFIDAFDGNSYQGQPGEISTPRNDSSLLARDVVDFGVVFYAQNASGQNAVIFPGVGESQGFRVPDDGIPSSAEIFVRILDEEGAKQISAFERGLIPSDDPDFWWKTVNQFSMVYTRRVQFRSGQL